MLPLDSYKKWCADNPDMFKRAQEFSREKWETTSTFIDGKLKQLDIWLEANATNKKARKTNWYKFVLNFLKPKEWDKPKETPYWLLPEDKPRRTSGNFEPQAVNSFLGRVFRMDSILVSPQTKKPQTIAQAQAEGAILPPIRKLTNRCELCGSSPVPILHKHNGQNICGLCMAKSE